MPEGATKGQVRDSGARRDRKRLPDHGRAGFGRREQRRSLAASDRPITFTEPMNLQDKRNGAQTDETSWPLKQENAALLEPGPPMECHVPAASLVLLAFGEIVAAGKAKRAPDFVAIVPGRGLHAAQDLRTLLEGGAFIDKDGKAAPRAAELPAIMAENDLDRLSHLCTAFAAYHQVMSALANSNGLVPLAKSEELTGVPAGAITLAGILGQAVLTREGLNDGSRWVNPNAFTDWLLTTFNMLEGASRQREVAVADLAQRALLDLRLAPFRFGRALKAALSRPELAMLEPIATGPEKLMLIERVADLHGDGTFRVVSVSADNLQGIRTLKKKKTG